VNSTGLKGVEMALSQLRRRIAVLGGRVERRFPKPKPPSEESIERMSEFLLLLLPNMAQEHWPLVEAHLKDPDQALHIFGGEKGPIPRV